MDCLTLAIITTVVLTALWLFTLLLIDDNREITNTFTLCLFSVLLLPALLSIAIIGSLCVLIGYIVSKSMRELFKDDNEG